MQSKEYEIQDVALWPNLFSFDENKKIRDKATQKLIDDTKTQFLLKNQEHLVGTDYQSFLDSDRDIYYPAKWN